MVNRDGKVVKYYIPTVSPLEIKKDIENLLEQWNSSGEKEMIFYGKNLAMRLIRTVFSL